MFQLARIGRWFLPTAGQHDHRYSQLLQPGVTVADRQKFRSLSLRLAAVLTLIASIALSRSGAFWPESTIVLIYALLSTMLVLPSVTARRPAFFSLALSVVDAAFVVAVLYDSILGPEIYDEHGVTTSGLVVAFILLTHVGFNSERREIIVFCATVLGSWLGLIGIAALLHEWSQRGTFLTTFFGPDLGLALSFGFTSVAVCMTAQARARARSDVSGLQRRHHNLSRFFSPMIVTELQEGSSVLHLHRRNAAVMFVDLRDFSGYAETAPASKLAGVLGDYRKLVSGTVFAFGGTVDKFMGDRDGVMIVFGQPEPADDDASRALECAFELMLVLDDWREAQACQGNRSFRIGIGIHYGVVVGGVLESGFHDEFTVVGDTVNIAQRLEALCELNATLVVSMSLLAEARLSLMRRNWVLYSDEIA